MEFLQNISMFDIIIGLLLIMLGLKGILSGFIKEASGLFGIIGGVYVASRVDMKVGHYINDIIGILSTDSAISLVGFTITLGLFWSASYASGQVLSKVLALSGLGIADRLLGFVFSAGKMFMIFAMIFYVISNTRLGTKLEKKLAKSQLYPIFIDVGNEIVALDETKVVKNIGKDVKSVIDKTKAKAKKTAKEETTKIAKKVAKETKEKVEKEADKHIKAIKKELKEDVKQQKTNTKAKTKAKKTTKKVEKKQTKKAKKQEKKSTHNAKKKVEKKVKKKVHKKKEAKKTKASKSHKSTKTKEKVLKKATKKVDDELKQIEEDIKKLKSSSGQELDLSDDENEVMKF